MNLKAVRNMFRLPSSWWSEGETSRLPVVDDSRGNRRAIVLAVPPEIIFQILDHVPLPTVLAFALTCKMSHHLAIPALNDRVIIIRQNISLFRTRAATNDPRNDLVHKVQVGRLDRPGEAEKWDLVSILQPVLEGFPHVFEVTGLGGTYVAGWSGLDTVAQAIGNKLTSLEIKIAPQITFMLPQASSLQPFLLCHF